MKSTGVLLSTCFLIYGFIFSCPVFSSGSIEKSERNVKGFHSVSFQTAGELFIEQGNREFLTIEAPAKTVSRITTEVRGDTLYIGYRGLFRRHDTEPIIRLGMTEVSGLSAESTCRITAEDISSDSLAVDSSSSGSVRIDNLRASELRVKISSSGSVKIGNAETETVYADITGSGDLVLTGSADSAELKCSSSGGVDGEGFSVNEAAVRLSSSGSVILHIDNRVEADISSRGFLSYYGSPDIILLRPESKDNLRALGKP